MQADDFESTENIFRSVKRANPDQWKDSRPTSAVFKDSKGASVDRGGDRNDEQACEALKDRFNPQAVVYLSVADCNKHFAYVYADKQPDNGYHCLLKDKDGNIKLPKATPGLLARDAKICYEFKED